MEKDESTDSSASGLRMTEGEGAHPLRFSARKGASCGKFFSRGVTFSLSQSSYRVTVSHADTRFRKP